MIVGEEVEGLVNSLLLLDDYHPRSQALGDLSELCIQSGLGIAENVAKISKASINFVDLVPAKVTVLVHAVKISAK